MRLFFAYLISALLCLSPAYAGGTLTLLGAGPGATSSSIPPSITFLGNNDVSAGDCNSTTSCTVSSVAFGAAYAERNIVFSTSCSLGTGASIGGVSAALAYASPTGYQFWAANVPSGTSGNIVLTSSGNCTSQIAIWRIDDLLSLTPTDTDESTTSSSPVTLTLTPGADGIGVFADSCWRNDSVDPAPAFSGVTQDFSILRTITTNRLRYLAAHGSGASVPTTLTFTGPCNSNAVLAGAGFR